VFLFKINNIGLLGLKERKMNRSEVSSKWNKCRIYVGNQLERTQGSVTHPNSHWSGKDFAW
jgi:hypothetical protein